MGSKYGDKVPNEASKGSTRNCRLYNNLPSEIRESEKVSGMKIKLNIWIKKNNFFEE